ncbi:hypothetical protein P8452_15373 [Trifolium repens]|nr:hypothetical protein P8452_15373 [Trifolium repens]
MSTATANDTNIDDPSLVSLGIPFMSGVAAATSVNSFIDLTEVLNFNQSEKRYGLAQCTRDISRKDCRSCLEAFILQKLSKWHNICGFGSLVDSFLILASNGNVSLHLNQYRNPSQQHYQLLKLKHPPVKPLCYEMMMILLQCRLYTAVGSLIWYQRKYRSIRMSQLDFGDLHNLILIFLEKVLMLVQYRIILCNMVVGLKERNGKRTTVDYLLFIVWDVNFNLNPDEVANIKYVNCDQLKKLLRKAYAGEEGLKL